MIKDTQPHFLNLSNSKIALHPEPQGVIQFIGSFVFGSFPAWAYKYLLQYLYSKGYSLILYSFPLNLFQFNHWEVTLKLMEEQYILKDKIIERLEESKSVVNVDIYLNSSNYLWLGHSLGCKYIMLLEILSNNPTRRRQVLEKCLLKKNREELIARIEATSQVFIQDQPSILLAPEISNTIRIIKSSLRISNNFVKPTQKETECMIKTSQELFNLMGIISFNWDNIAEDDVSFMIDQIKTRAFQPYLYTELAGWHFEPLALHIQDLGETVVQFFSQLRQR